MISKGEEKRLLIFNKYKDNLNLLIDNGFITGDKGVYLCPICLKPHIDLDSDDPLTLEDAPPKSLGGTANVLTCKSCNNIAGHKIDVHLVERMREIDSAKFIPGTETDVKVNIDGEIYQGRISVEKDGTMKMFHSKKNNHPGKLDKKMEQIESGKIIDIKFLKTRVIPEHLEYALLKTAYIMAFERFGYSLILDDCYNTVRKQLQNPETRIYPEGFWFSPPYPKSMSGVYFICDEGLESLVALFNLDTGITERMFGALLPLPIIQIENVLINLKEKLRKENGQINLTLYSREPIGLKYLQDIDTIASMYNWIDQHKEASSQ